MEAVNVRAAKAERSAGELIAAWQAFRAAAPVASIKSEREYKALAKFADQLIDLGAGNERHPLADLLGMVGDLIARWEDDHVQIPEAAPGEVLKFLMQEHGLKQKDLSDIVSQGVLSEILSGKRAVSRNLAKKLAERFGVSAASFL
jgi:HTH-type transcriptional regulator / antitoxin HigA